VTEAADRDRIEHERRTRGVTFREVALAYLGWLKNVRGAKPSTLRDHESILAEPGVAYRRGNGTTKGHVMAGLGDRPASKITTREVEDVLATVSASGASPRTVNSIGVWCQPSSTTAASPPRSRCRQIRRELLALRWHDVDFARCALTIARAMSARVEASTKSGRVRRVPLADQAAAALERMSQRDRYTAPDDLVFCNVYGRTLDDSALRRRYRRAQVAAGVRPLRFHDLRHTFGSLLAANGVDVVTIQKAMGHSAPATTSRYLHARPASEQAQVFTAAFTSTLPEAADRVAR
jgi:integrase